jgi:hypothetical protein
MNTKYQWRLTLISFVPLAFFLLNIAWPTSAYAQLSSLPPLNWPNKKLSVSFAPDLVAIGKYRNELNQHLNSSLSEEDWKIEILRACQEWSRHCGIDFFVAADAPRNFGVPGLSQNDPRFGDIRFGAFPQENVLGNAIPYQPNAGVWAGDIFLNTNTRYLRSPNSSVSANEVDLFSVVLHEIGNSLGLTDDMQNIESVMFFLYAGAREQLSSVDIANIQFLYGPKDSDRFELATNNNSIRSATRVQWEPMLAETLKQSQKGRIQHKKDRDYYRISGSPIAEKLWVTVRCKGHSLLCPKITITDRYGKEIDTISANSPVDNNITKEITNFYPNDLRYIVVEWSGYPDFDFGDYEIEFDFRESSPAYQSLENDDDDGNLPFSDADDEGLVDLLFETVGPVDTEVGANDNFATATTLYSPLGVEPGSRFETIGTILPTDVDTLAIRTSNSAHGTLMAHLRPLSTTTKNFNLEIFDDSFVRVNASMTRYVDGDVDIEIARVKPNTTYYFVLQASQVDEKGVNYLFVTDVADINKTLNTIQQVRLTPNSPEYMGTFTAYKTQLFKFSLTTNSQDQNNQAVQLTIYSETGRVESILLCRAGSSCRQLVWLQAGRHTFRFTALSRDSGRIMASTSTLRGAAVSDDEGPILIDPSGNPISGSQLPDRNPAPPPLWEFPKFLIGLILPPENPWFSRPTLPE